MIVFVKSGLFVLTAVLILVLCAQADVPQMFNYQGRLTDNSPSQNPIDATLPMTFRIYGTPTGGFTAWSESWAAVISRVPP